MDQLQIVLTEIVFNRLKRDICVCNQPIYPIWENCIRNESFNTLNTIEKLRKNYIYAEIICFVLKNMDIKLAVVSFWIYKITFASENKITI